jgi:hypothetical protein
MTTLLHWALQELAGYALAALGGVLAFTIWAVVYTYVVLEPGMIDSFNEFVRAALEPKP